MTVVVETSGGSITVTPTAIDTIVARIRDHIAEDFSQQDVLQNGSDLTSSTSPFTVANGSYWAAGKRLEFDDSSGEQALIFSSSATSGPSSLTVRRGAYSTTASTHSDGCYLIVNPRFGRQQITEAVTSALAWMSGWIWTPTIIARTISTTTSWYTMPSDFLGWLNVQQDSIDTTPVPQVYGPGFSGFPVQIGRGVPTDIASTTIALRIPNLYNTTNPLEITYGADTTTDTIAPGPQTEAVVYGACSILLTGKDIPRTAEDVSQGDEAIAPGTTLRTGASFYGLFQYYRRQAKQELIREVGPLHIL